MSESMVKKFLHRNEKARKFIYRIAMETIVKFHIRQLNIPIIFITGTNGKTTVTKLIEKIYLNAGYNVGTCFTFGVSHNGKLIAKGDHSGGGGVWKAAKCPNADILVLETARKAIIDFGLGFSKCQVGVVTNLHEDHLGFDGIDNIEQMAQIKSKIPENTKQNGVIILNGDQEIVKKMTIKSKAQPIYFVLREDPLQFKKVFYLKNKYIYYRNEDQIKRIIHIDEIPITYKGMQEYNVANVMAAVGSVFGMQKRLYVNQDIIIKTLKKFGLETNECIGRFFTGYFQGERILFCNSKNPEGYRNDIEFITKIKNQEGYKHIVGIATATNRQKRFYEEISKIIANVCDLYFIRPPKEIYLQGRRKEDIVNTLSKHLPADKVVSKEIIPLTEVISISKKRLEGKTLFVHFFTRVDSSINIQQMLNNGELKSEIFSST